MIDKKNYILYKKYLSTSPERTRKIAENLTKQFKKNDVVAFTGQLGAGKTCFIKGIGKKLGISNKEIISPTFVILRIYDGKRNIYHLDLYRIKDYKELENIGYREFLSIADLIVIEWADRIKEIYNDFNWIININYISEKKREIEIYKKSEA